MQLKNSMRATLFFKEEATPIDTAASD